MSHDGRPDAERNQYNVAGIQTANPQQKGDISVGGDTTDPTGRAIAVNLSTSLASDGQVLTVKTSESTGLAWETPQAAISGTPNKLVVFDQNGNISSSSLLETPDTDTVSVESTTPVVSVRRTDASAIVELTVAVPGTQTTGFSQTLDSRGNNNRLSLNEAVTAQRQALFLDAFDISGLFVRGSGSDGLDSNNKVMSRHALAHFDAGTTKSKPGQVVVLPSLTAAQRDSLVSDIQTEYTMTLGVNSQAQKVHNNQVIINDTFIDNGVFHCADDDNYYVLKLTSPPTIKRLLTTDDIGQSIWWETDFNVVLTSKFTQDYDVLIPFNFGQVLKISTELSVGATLSNSAILQLTFYNHPTRAASNQIETVDVIVATSGITSTYPSVTIEDITSSKNIYFRVTNDSLETVNAVITLKGIGSL